MYNNNYKDNKKLKNIFNLKILGIVKVCTFILVFVSIPTFIVGCSSSKQNLTTTKNTANNTTNNAAVENVKNPYPIDVANIRSISRLNVSPVQDIKYAVL